MPTTKLIRTLIIKSLLGDLTDSEREKLTSWIEESNDNKNRYEDLAKRWNNGELSDDWKKISLEQNWEEILAKANQSKPKTLRFIPLIKYAAAAAILLFSTFWYLNQETQNVIKNTGRTFELVKLPDRTKVWLKPQASIAFAAKSFTEERILSLKGEAFFEVQKDQIPFTILATGSSIEVLGTSFNVSSTSSSTELLLVEGSVKFSSKINEEVLIPGESAIFDGQRIKKTTDQVDFNLIGWKTGTFRFSNTPLEKVMDMVKVYYGIEVIIAAEKRGLLLTTSIDQLDLNEFIHELTFVLDVKVALDGTTLSID